MTAGARDTWLDQLDALHTAATPGPWTAEPNYQREKPCRCGSCWEPIEGSWDINPVDGPDCPEHGCWHNIAISEADAAAIVAEHNATSDLIRIAREHEALRQAVEALAGEWDTEAATVAATERHARTNSSARRQRGYAAGLRNAADALRRLLADAAPHTGQETP